MNVLECYIPPDRRNAIARELVLPDRAIGAVLFADISGFTPITEAMTRILGVRRGADELTQQLNLAYDALIAVIEKYGGSVISFAGDATLCWFAEDSERTSPAVLRATACAFALQETMHQFAAVPLPDGSTTALAIKVTVTSGPVHRFVVGDPQIRLIDLIAGATVTRSGTAEHLAQGGEILLDTESVHALDEQIEIKEWRADKATGESYAVARAFHAQVTPHASPSLPELSVEQLKPWLHDQVFQRLRAEDETFLTELRPVVALFTRFQGVDYDADPEAGNKLNQFITRAQQILYRYGGALLEVTIGDKGSYFYATFGAPYIHEDDARRAVFAARELFSLCRALDFLEPLQVGISQGVMRVGAYGGQTRKMYGAQGDEVNLAARLMTEAAPGTLLVSRRIQKSVANELDLEPMSPIQLKGKSEPLLPFVVQGLRETRVQQLQEAYYALPMIGREREMALIESKLELARQGKGQIIGITARAGMGKSRLTAEVIRLVRRRRESSYGGECQSFGVNIPYLVWRPILRAFFGLDANLPLRRQLRALESTIQDWAPERAAAMPLLGALLDLAIPENDFTRALEPEFRQSALHALLRDCFAAAGQEARSQEQLVLIVLEDLHWVDPASRTLLLELAANTALLPIVFLLNYRPPDSETGPFSYIDQLPNFRQIALDDLTDVQGEGLIRAKLAQHAPESAKAIPQTLITFVTVQAQGNPFYIEQLLDYMHDRGMNLYDPQILEHLELPNTLHRLVLSRMNQLSEHQQLALKAASIIGRAFTLAHLSGFFPEVGSIENLRADFSLLQRYELTIADPSEPELAYLFKHIVTHQVAYESLAYATRAKLHLAYAQFLESQSDPERVLDLLAYHYDQTDDVAKRQEYLRRAGIAAAARFANTEAVDYLTRALALTPNTQLAERFTLLRARARVFDVQGARQAQHADLVALEEITRALEDPFKHFQILLEQGWLAERLAEHETARRVVRRVTQDLTTKTLIPDERALVASEINLLEGVILWQQGNATAARPFMENALLLARQNRDHNQQARALGFLSAVLRETGNNMQAQVHYKSLLEQARANSDKRRELSALNQLGQIANTRGEFAEAEALFMAGLHIVREIGDSLGQVLILSNLAMTTTDRGEPGRALTFFEDALTVAERIGDRKEVCRITLNLGEAYRLLGDTAMARDYTKRAFNMAGELGTRLDLVIAQMNHAAIALAQNEPADARAVVMQTLPLAREIQYREGAAFLLNTLGQAQLALGELSAAQESFAQALAIWETLEPSPYSLQTHAGLAELALRQREFAQARNECDAIFEFLRAHPNRQGDPSALSALLTCYRVLSAMNDANARAVLDDAYAQLQTRTDKITDARMRQSFLENVPHNAEIVRAWNYLHAE